MSAILFDEPLTVIDPHLKWQLRSQLKHLHKRFNYTMVYVTHDQTEALTFADKVVVMYDGAVVQMGTPEELFERPKHTFVGYFIGSPGMNVVPCHVDGKQAMVAGHAFAMEQGLSNIPEGASLEVGIRPEFLSLSREGSGPTVSIQKVEDLGRFKVASVRLEDHEFKVMVNEEDEVPTDGARLVVDPTHVKSLCEQPFGRGGLIMNKWSDNRAWWLVLPVVLIVAFSAVIPLMTVVNYAFQDTFGNNEFFWAGIEWFREVLRSDRFHGALGRQFLFSFIILSIEIPLGIAIALAMPKKGLWVPFCLILMALPLLIPWNVVGNDLADFLAVLILVFWVLFWMDWVLNTNYTQNALDAWVTLIVMDVWHWTSLVVLLCYAGLQSIPDAYYQAARIDGASKWATFRFIQLPKMNRVLLIAVLLRFMDSFMIYTEPFVVTGGGPGNATTFLSIDLVQMAIGQFDLGPAAAMSLVYFLIILLFSWVFFTVMSYLDRAES